MFYYIFASFFIISYLLPFFAMKACIYYMQPSDFLWQSAMAVGFSALLVYMALCIIRCIVYFIISIILLFHSAKLNRSFKYNTLVLFILFFIDNIILICWNTHFSRSSTPFTFFDYGMFVVMFSLVATYFPIWFVFATRNTVCWIMNKLRSINSM